MSVRVRGRGRVGVRGMGKGRGTDRDRVGVRVHIVYGTIPSRQVCRWKSRDGMIGQVLSRTFIFIHLYSYDIRGMIGQVLSQHIHLYSTLTPTFMVAPTVTLIPCVGASFLGKR